MNKVKLIELIKILAVLILVASFFGSAAFLSKKGDVPSLFSLLPDVKSWKHSEEPQNYIPVNLFEYINGAAEIYLAYDFKELAVGQYQKETSSASLSVEIYDMGNEKNSFGIYSAERYPESRFIPIGSQGYLEEGTLNFIAGRYYIKLLCFDCGEESDDILKSFSQEVVTKIKDKALLPPLLLSFPQEGLIKNSEKFILRNFLGYSFLHDGYVANYRLQDREFDCFIIEGKRGEDAQSMMEQYLDKKNALDIKKISSGYVFKDRYYHNIYIARVGNYICGVMKIQDDFREIGEHYFGLLIEGLKK